MNEKKENDCTIKGGLAFAGLPRFLFSPIGTIFAAAAGLRYHFFPQSLRQMYHLRTDQPFPVPSVLLVGTKMNMKERANSKYIHMVSVICTT